jgi:hypothetical protein
MAALVVYACISSFKFLLLVMLESHDLVNAFIVAQRLQRFGSLMITSD